LRTALAQKTPNTIDEIEELKREYQKIRTQGFAVSNGENSPGAFGISAPIHDKRGNVFACICVAAGPKERFTADKVQTWIPLVVGAGKEISQRLAGFNSSMLF